MKRDQLYSCESCVDVNHSLHPSLEGEIRHDRDSLQRIILLALASIALELPQTLLGIFGYGSIPVIIAETALVLAGFLLVLHATASEKMLQKVSPSKLLAVVIALITVPEIIEFTVVQPLNLTTGILELAGSLVIIAGSLLLFRSKLTGSRMALYMVMISIFITATIGTATWLGTPKYPTDEVLLDMFSAHLFLIGKNPYLASNTANAFSYYGFTSGYTLSFSTPRLTGGFVSALSYPALSFIYFIPAVGLNINATLWTMPAYILPAAAIAFAYRKSRLLALIALLFLVLNPQYFYQIRMGYIDVLWVGFSMLSVYFYRKPWLSGILFGLALAVKQDPVFLAPFILVFIWREEGVHRALRWVSAAVITFLIVNGYFIILGPGAFISSLIGPESSGLLGIGFGPSQISFLGYFPMSPTFYTLLEISAFLILLVLYAFKYERLKYAFLSFPILIYLFNYRLLLEYIMFWPLAALIIVPMRMPTVEREQNLQPSRSPNKERGTKSMALAVVALCILIAAVPAGYAIHEHDQVPIFRLSNPVVYEDSSGEVYKIMVNVSLKSSSIQATPVLFRIVHEGAINDSNGLLWIPSHNTYVGATPVNLSLLPLQASQQFPLDGTYILIAYYGDAIGEIPLRNGTATVI